MLPSTGPQQKVSVAIVAQVTYIFYLVFAQYRAQVICILPCLCSVQGTSDIYFYLVFAQYRAQVIYIFTLPLLSTSCHSVLPSTGPHSGVQSLFTCHLSAYLLCHILHMSFCICYSVTAQYRAATSVSYIHSIFVMLTQE